MHVTTILNAGSWLSVLPWELIPKAFLYASVIIHFCVTSPAPDPTWAWPHHVVYYSVLDTEYRQGSDAGGKVAMFHEASLPCMHVQE